MVSASCARNVGVNLTDDPFVHRFIEHVRTARRTLVREVAQDQDAPSHRPQLHPPSAGAQLWQQATAEHSCTQLQLLLPILERTMPRADIQGSIVVVLAVLGGVGPAPMLQALDRPLVDTLQVPLDGLYPLLPGVRGTHGHVCSDPAHDAEQLPVDGIHGMLPDTLLGLLVEEEDTALVVRVLCPAFWQSRRKGLLHDPAQILSPRNVHPKVQPILSQVGVVARALAPHRRSHIFESNSASAACSRCPRSTLHPTWGPH
mmetsp:Transcript_130010/g.324002  ORF Transcript_130010/g.324002 Transcript_130010/m.324002 type:complete len:259 (-) Transcript_130010:346-1122(-)